MLNPINPVKMSQYALCSHQSNRLSRINPPAIRNTIRSRFMGNLRLKKSSRFKVQGSRLRVKVEGRESGSQNPGARRRTGPFTAKCRKKEQWKLELPETGFPSRSLGTRSQSAATSAAWIRFLAPKFWILAPGSWILPFSHLIFARYSNRLLVTTEMLLSDMATAASIGWSCRSIIGRFSNGFNTPAAIGMSTTL